MTARAQHMMDEPNDVAPHDSARRIDAGAVAVALVVLALCVAKHLVCLKLPIHVRHYATDDELMVEMAEGLLAGDWLGPYSAVVLMKGCGFPLFLAAIHTLGISYLGALDVLNSLASVFFCLQLRPLVKRRAPWLVLVAVVLLNPVCCAELTYQRVYRNSITAAQALLLFGSYLGLYLQMRPSLVSDGSPDHPRLWRVVALSAIGGFSLWWLWNTREDGMWVMPFVVVATAVMLGMAIAARARSRIDSARLGVIACLLALPLAVLVGGNVLVSRANEARYGVAIRNESSDGSFADALRAIYAVACNDEVRYASVSREKLDRLYEASPSLALISPQLEEQLAYYDAVDRGRGDGAVEDGWFFWALRRAAYDSGVATTLVSSEAFYAAVAAEVQAALDDPSSGLERQATMPSALMSPWRSEYAVELPRAFANALFTTVSFSDVTASSGPSGKAGVGSTRRFEALTGNRAAFPDDAENPPADEQEFRARAEESVVIIGAVTTVYQLLSPLAACAGCVALVACVIKAVRSGEPRACAAVLLVTLALALSAAVITAGVAYSEISAFTAIYYFYLAGAYPLVLAAELLPIAHLLSGGTHE